MKKIIAIVLVCLILAGLGCDVSGTRSTMNKQYSDVSQQAAKFQETQPAPVIEFSNTRQAVIDRVKRWNDPNKISYIYLVSFGRVMAFYTVKGSVESKRSYLFPVTVPYDPGYYDGAVVDNPDIDGTYGDNMDSIFFFTTDDVYVEWHGDYMWVDQPLKLATAPELTYVAPLDGGTNGTN